MIRFKVGRGIKMKKIILATLMLLLLFGCDVNTDRLERIKVSGELIRIEDSFRDFTEIIVVGPFDIVFDQDIASGIELESYESLIDVFSAEIHDDVLLLYLLDTSKVSEFTFGEDNLNSSAILSGSRLKWPNNKKVLNLRISHQELEKIQVIGECSIVSEDIFAGERLSLEIAGALNFEAALDMHKFDAEIAGAANLKLSGSVDVFDIECAGAGTIKAYDLIAKKVNIEIAGACNAKIHALEEINAEIAGVGTIKYKGNPTIINFEKAGIGSLKPAEKDKEDQ